MKMSLIPKQLMVFCWVFLVKLLELKLKVTSVSFKIHFGNAQRQKLAKMHLCPVNYLPN